MAELDKVFALLMLAWLIGFALVGMGAAVFAYVQECLEERRFQKRIRRIVEGR